MFELHVCESSIIELHMAFTGIHSRYLIRYSCAVDIVDGGSGVCHLKSCYVPDMYDGEGTRLSE